MMLSEYLSVPKEPQDQDVHSGRPQHLAEMSSSSFSAPPVLVAHPSSSSSYPSSALAPMLAPNSLEDEAFGEDSGDEERGSVSASSRRWPKSVALLGLFSVLCALALRGTLRRPSRAPPAEALLDAPDVGAPEEAIDLWFKKPGDLYDCNAGLAMAHLGWAEEKKQWCCLHASLGCEPGMSTTVAPYDCNAGLAKAALGWAAQKKKWCCANEKKGCPQAQNCNEGNPASWPLPKADYCCLHEHKGCPTTTTENLIEVMTVMVSFTRTRTSTTTTTKTTTTTTTVTSTTKTWTSTTSTRTSTTKTTTTTTTRTGTSTTTTRTTTTRTTTSTTTHTTTTTTTTVFRCHVGESWSVKKSEWCCSYKGIGCPTTTSLPYSCAGGIAGWQPGQRAWCCMTIGKGCETTTTLPYDCDAGYVNWQCGWSQGKKDYCCDHRGMGCPLEDPYNCEIGYDDWQNQWSEGQQAWCCLDKQRACPVAKPTVSFDCKEDLERWEEVWAEEKQEWCCKHEDRGCFRCGEGFEDWEFGWNPAKKDWCCRHFDRGCDESLRSKECSLEALQMLASTGSAVGKREWCCRNENALCDAKLHLTQEPFDCDTNFKIWTVSWTEGQKAWCCLHRGRGCKEDDPSVNCWKWIHNKQTIPLLPAPPGPKGYCLSWGSTHFETFDHSFVDIFTEGEYWLVKSKEILIQTRLKATPYTSGLAATNSIAIGGPILQNHRLEVMPLENNGQILWDSKPILQQFPSTFLTGCCGEVRYDSTGDVVDVSMLAKSNGMGAHIVHVDLVKDVKIEVMRWANHLNVRVVLSQGFDVDGLCGKYNNEITDDSYSKIRSRIGGRVPAKELLFHDGPVEVHQLKKRLTLDDCDPNRMASAKSTCLQDRPENMGVLLEDCIFDVCFGGEQYAAEDAATAGESSAASSRPGSRQVG